MHISRGVSRALGNCGPGNILWKVAKVTDRSKTQAVETEKAQLVVHVATMMHELTQKSEEIQKYHAEQVVALSPGIHGSSGEIIDKAHLYDQLMQSAEPSSI